MKYISSSYFETINGLKYKEGWSGAEADVLAFCEMMKIPMICYIGITDEYQMER